MISRPNQTLLTLSAIAVLGCTTTISHAELIVLDEQFESYSTNDDVEAAWVRADTTAPNLSRFGLQTEFGPGPTAPANQPIGSQAVSLANGIVYTEFDQTLTDDTSLSFGMLHNNYGRSGVVALMNAAGTEGYGIRWNSTLVNQFGGNGAISIVKFDLDDALDNWDTERNDDTGLSSPVNSGHPALGYEVTAAPDNNSNNATYSTTWDGFNEFELTWDADTGTLTGFSGGTQFAQAIDTDFTEFSRLYVIGNTSVFFDDFLVTTVVPEPGSVALLTAGGLWVVSRRRLRSARSI